jgi:hypothetical protein
VTTDTALRVVVRPPNVPAPPPISLLTQNNVEDDPSARWENGGGTVWSEPIRQEAITGVWQQWPGTGSASSSTKPGSVDAAASELGPIQRPIMATLVLEQGQLAEWALRAAPEGNVQQQMEIAFAAVLPRIIEHELWTGAVASAAGWADQFRLKSLGHFSQAATSVLPFVRALSRAEQAAADFGFIDNYGGAFIHCKPSLFSLLTSKCFGLSRAPSGRQWTTPSGCTLVCEPGATGSWTETQTDAVDDVGAGPACNDTTSSWLFVTPPVRIRLGGGGLQTYASEFAFDNEHVYVGERPFVMEASVRDAPTSVGIPVSHTQEL